MPNPILKVDNLTVELTTRAGIAPVVENFSFELAPDECLSFVGESGCGKSITALAIMGLLPERISKIANGSIKFDGEELTSASQDRLQEIRGNDISMIFQEPMTSLNPVYTVGEQIAEVLRTHQNLGKRAALASAIELLDAVRIPNPATRVKDYPFQLSGGQRQRVMISIALACKPKVLIADEPTTALDVTVQAQIFDLLADLRKQFNTSIILITHDMGAVSELAEKMIVMYAGRKVEEGPVSTVLNHPRHPYTKGLISCVPHIDTDYSSEQPDLTEIPGIVPALTEFGRDMCLFASRCNITESRCEQQRPEEISFDSNHISACWKANEL